MRRYLNQYSIDALAIIPVNGGYLNRFNNNGDSILRIITSKQSFIIKISNDNDNIVSYFSDLLGTKKVSDSDIESFFTFISFLPDRKEYKFYKLFCKTDDRIDCIPKVEFAEYDENTNKSVILMEDLVNYTFFDYHSSVPISFEICKTAIETISTLHNFFYTNSFAERFGCETALDRRAHLINQNSIEVIVDLHIKKYAHLLSPRFIHLLKNLNNEIIKSIIVINNNIKILTHNDYNIRNTCYRYSGDSCKFKVFDWDLASVQNPHYDVVEYMMMMPAPLSKDEFEEAIALYINRSFIKYDVYSFKQCLYANVIWHVLSKWVIYALVDGIDSDFLLRLSTNVLKYIDYLMQ